MLNVFVTMLLVLMPALSLAQGIECQSTHAYMDGKKKGAKQQKPTTASLGLTLSATGCLELCMQKRAQHAQQGKALFGKMQYSCHYNGKTLNNTTQILH